DRTPAARSACAAGRAMGWSFRDHRVALTDDAGRDADRNRTVRDGLAHQARRADHRATANRDAVEDLGAGAQPGSRADAHALGGAGLIEYRPRGIGEVVIAANHVAVGGHEGVTADAHLAGREHLAVE